MTLRSLACLAVSAAALWATGLGMPRGAQAQEPEGQCHFLAGSRSLNSITLAGGARITYLGTPNIACNDGVRIRADSAVVFSAQNMSYLMGNVRFRDATRELRSDEARYFSRQGRLQASGHLFVRDTVQGSVIENGDLVYLRKTSYREQEEMTVTTGPDRVRPTALLYMRAAPDTAAPDTAAQDTAAQAVPDSLAAAGADTTAAVPDTAGALPDTTAQSAPDSAAVPPDTAGVSPDTTGLPPDTTAPAAVHDTLAPVRDTLPPAPDTLLPVRDTLPPARDTVPPGRDTLPPLRDTLPPSGDTVPPVRDTSAAPADTGGVAVQLPLDTTHVEVLQVPPLPDSLREAADTAGPPPLRPEAQAEAPTEPAPADTIPYRVEANRIYLAGDQYFRSSGNVVIHRDSLTAHGDSAEYDQTAGLMHLGGSARVESSGYDLSGRDVNLAVPGGEVRNITATRDAKLVGEDLTLTAPVIRIFLNDGLMEHLVAVPLSESDEELAVPAVPVGPRSAPPEGAGPDSAEVAQPLAVAQQFRLSADSLDVLAPGQVLDRIFAAGNARGASTSRDSLNVDVLPPIARSDWLAGDTVIATFEKVEPGPGVQADTAQYRLDRLEASGDARTLYRLVPSDSTFRPGTDVPAVHYATGTRIVMVMSQGEVDSMEIEGPTRGWHLEPQSQPARDTVPPDTSATVGPDTAQAARPGQGERPSPAQPGPERSPEGGPGTAVRSSGWGDRGRGRRSGR